MPITQELNDQIDRVQSELDKIVAHYVKEQQKKGLKINLLEMPENVIQKSRELDELIAIYQKLDSVKINEGGQ